MVEFRQRNCFSRVKQPIYLVTTIGAQEEAEAKLIDGMTIMGILVDDNDKACVYTEHKWNPMKIVALVVGVSKSHVDTVPVWNNANDENGYYGNW